MRRFELTDDQWEKIKHLLPGKEGNLGCTAIDNRLIVEAMLRLAPGLNGVVSQHALATGTASINSSIDD